MIGLLDGLKLAGLDPVAETDPKVLGPAAEAKDPDSLNPLNNDHLFYTYLDTGAVWQALDGSQWMINEITPNGLYNCSNMWYPRERKLLTRNQIRKTIEAYVEPVLQHVPPPRPGDLDPE
jgi:hypothetical protein